MICAYKCDIFILKEKLSRNYPTIMRRVIVLIIFFLFFFYAITSCASRVIADWH